MSGTVYECGRKIKREKGVRGWGCKREQAIVIDFIF